MHGVPGAAPGPGPSTSAMLFPRLDQALSVCGEVTREHLFLEALYWAVAQWPGAELLDHCCVGCSVLGEHQGPASCPWLPCDPHPRPGDLRWAGTLLLVSSKAPHQGPLLIPFKSFLLQSLPTFSLPV